MGNLLVAKNRPSGRLREHRMASVRHLLPSDSALVLSVVGAWADLGVDDLVTPARGVSLIAEYLRVLLTFEVHLGDFIRSRSWSLIKVIFECLLEGITNVDQQLVVQVEWLIAECRIFVRDGWRVVLDDQLVFWQSDLTFLQQRLRLSVAQNALGSVRMGQAQAIASHIEGVAVWIPVGLNRVEVQLELVCLLLDLRHALVVVESHANGWHDPSCVVGPHRLQFGQRSSSFDPFLLIQASSKRWLHSDAISSSDSLLYSPK